MNHIKLFKDFINEAQRHKPVDHIENIEVKDKKNSKAEEDVESYISGNTDTCPRCGEHSRDCECSSNDPWSTQNYHRVTKKSTE